MNELQQAQELLRNLIQAVQEVVASGEQIPDELANQLAEIISALTQKIETLKGAAQVPLTQIEDNLQQAMPSSNVEGFSYDPKNQQLFVRFLGQYPNKNGPIYSYNGVPKEIFELFRRGSVPARTDGKNKWGRWWKGKVPSIGASLYTLIKTANYPYQRMS